MARVFDAGGGVAASVGISRDTYDAPGGRVQQALAALKKFSLERTDADSALIRDWLQFQAQNTKAIKRLFHTVLASNDVGRIDTLIEGLSLIRAPRGTLVYKQGDRSEGATSFYVVVDGGVEVWHHPVTDPPVDGDTLASVGAGGAGAMIGGGGAGRSDALAKLGSRIGSVGGGGCFGELSGARDSSVVSLGSLNADGRLQPSDLLCVNRAAFSAAQDPAAPGKGASPGKHAPRTANVLVHVEDAIQHRVAFMRRLFLFEGVPDAELAYLAYFMSEHKAGEGGVAEILFDTGDHADAVHFVVSGSVSISKPAIDHKLKEYLLTLEHVKAPMWFGEMDLVSGSPVRTTRAQTVQPVVVSSVPSHLLHEVFMSKRAKAAYETRARLKRVAQEREGWYAVRREEAEDQQAGISYEFVEPIQNEFISNPVTGKAEHVDDVWDVMGDGPGEDVLSPLTAHATPSMRNLNAAVAGGDTGAAALEAAAANGAAALAAGAGAAAASTQDSVDTVAGGATPAGAGPTTADADAAAGESTSATTTTVAGAVTIEAPEGRRATITIGGRLHDVAKLQLPGGVARPASPALFMDIDHRTPRANIAVAAPHMMSTNSFTAGGDAAAAFKAAHGAERQSLQIAIANSNTVDAVAGSGALAAAGSGAALVAMRNVGGSAPASPHESVRSLGSAGEEDWNAASPATADVAKAKDAERAARKREQSNREKKMRAFSDIRAVIRAVAAFKRLLTRRRMRNPDDFAAVRDAREQSKGTGGGAASASVSSPTKYDPDRPVTPLKGDLAASGDGHRSGLSAKRLERVRSRRVPGHIPERQRRRQKGAATAGSLAAELDAADGATGARTLRPVKSMQPRSGAKRNRRRTLGASQSFYGQQGRADSFNWKEARKSAMRTMNMIDREYADAMVEVGVRGSGRDVLVGNAPVPGGLVAAVGGGVGRPKGPSLSTSGVSNVTQLSPVAGTPSPIGSSSAESSSGSAASGSGASVRSHRGTGGGGGSRLRPLGADADKARSSAAPSPLHHPAAATSVDSRITANKLTPVDGSTRSFLSKALERASGGTTPSPRQSDSNSPSLAPLSGVPTEITASPQRIGQPSTSFRIKSTDTSKGGGAVLEPMAIDVASTAQVPGDTHLSPAGARLLGINDSGHRKLSALSGSDGSLGSRGSGRRRSAAHGSDVSRARFWDDT